MLEEKSILNSVCTHWGIEERVERNRKALLWEIMRDKMLWKRRKKTRWRKGQRKKKGQVRSFFCKSLLLENNQQLSNKKKDDWWLHVKSEINTELWVIFSYLSTVQTFVQCLEIQGFLQRLVIKMWSDLHLSQWYIFTSLQRLISSGWITKVNPCAKAISMEARFRH